MKIKFECKYNVMENKEYIEKIKNKIKQIYNLGCYIEDEFSYK